MLFNRVRSTLIDGIEVRGRSEFLLRTGESLALLGRAARIGFIQAHIAVIRQGRRSGMKAWAEKPTFVVGNRTWQHSVLWYAEIGRASCRERVGRRGQDVAGEGEK